MNGQQIAEGRKRMGLSQTEFADKLGVSRGAVHLWETNRGDPNRTHRLALADLFGIDPEQMNHVAAVSAVSTPSDNGRVPVLRTVLHTSSKQLWDFRLTNEPVDMVAPPSKLRARPDLKAFYVPTDVMEPRWFPGEMLWISNDRIATVGEFVVVQRKNHDGNELHSEDVVVGRLVKLAATYVEVEQYKPHKHKRAQRRDISIIWRVVPTAEFS